MNAILESGSVIDHHAQYIVHQCNCITEKASGLAEDLFNKFPNANIYKQRNGKHPYWHKPGELYITGDDEDRKVINMTSQFLPGGPGKTFEILPGMVVKETIEMREKLFVQCLKKIAEIEDLQSIAFPWRIGCGIAGGDWSRYRFVIDKFAKKMHTKGIDVFIIKREEDE